MRYKMLRGKTGLKHFGGYGGYVGHWRFRLGRSGSGRFH